jgi:RNA polymerase sigma-70 factor, ECF subfamily
MPADDELMLRLQAGDHEALGLLFDGDSRLLLSVALRVLHDYGEAEDVVQDSFFYLYQKATLFDPVKGTAKAWLAQVALHRALDRKAEECRNR